MLLTYLTPALLAWEAFVTLALFGYGLALLRLLKRRGLPLGVAICTGIATWLLLGGLLNLAHLATKPILRTLLALGFLLFLYELRDATLRQRLSLRRLWPTTTPTRAVAGVLILWFSLCFVVHLGTFAWNRFDDLQAYTAFADKASALGGTTPDPFSERRITSGVGGALYLNVTLLAGAGNASVDYLEGSLGLLALLLLTGALTQRFRLGQWQTIAVFAAAALFTLGRANISSVNFSAALFFALLILQLEPRPNPILTGLLAGAAFTLKSSNIPFCVLFLAGCALAQAWRARSPKPLLQLAFSGVTGLCFVLPWAIKHRLDEATALFPSLGRGFHISAYGFPTIMATVPPLISLGASLPDLLPPLLAGLLCLYLLRKTPSIPVITFLFAAALAAPLFSVAVGAEDLDRFLLPILNLAAILFLCILLAAPPSLPRRAAIALFACWAAGFLALAANLEFYRDANDLAILFGHPGMITRYEAIRTPADMARARREVQRAQAAIPAGATLLEAIQDAYAFDWQRNNILFADYPGMASPPPGLPLDGTAAQLRAYLLTHGVHYLMLDQTLDRTQYPSVDWLAFRAHPQVLPSWREVLFDRKIGGYSRMEFQVAARTQQLFSQLATAPRVLYREGPLTVVDLDKD